LINIVVWILAAFAAREYPSLLGSMVIAYTLGLRHAVDADHLAAIDNVTRNLIYQESVKSRAPGQDTPTPPICVGLFFSLGHSTVVIIASVALAVAATAIKDKFAAFGETGGIIGTSVSTAFLLLIGLINLFVLFQVVQELRRIRRAGGYSDRDHIAQTIEEPSNGTDSSLEGGDSKAKAEVDSSGFRSGGLLARIFRPLFNLVDRSWKMYPLGVLFGLGFDTATEVGMLGIAATSAKSGFPMVVTLIFPALFTAGMSLIDTLDGIFMANAYGWAFVNPVKKLWYNFVVTLLGVIVAFTVGIIELLGLLAQELALKGPFWDFFVEVGDNFGLVGYIIIGAFVVTWIFGVLFYHYGSIKALETRALITDEGTNQKERPGDIQEV
jgi:high-affinity nickel-transport protein